MKKSCIRKLFPTSQRISFFSCWSEKYYRIYTPSEVKHGSLPAKFLTEPTLLVVPKLFILESAVALKLSDQVTKSDLKHKSCLLER